MKNEKIRWSYQRRNLLIGLFFSLILVVDSIGSANANEANLETAPKKDRPNVLFIIADDLNTQIGCYGSPFVKTPNIDRLATSGVRFEKAYCQFPLCGPSRNSMLTGLYPNSTGILANAQIFRQTIPSHVSLPQAFRRAGYYTGRIGKLYHYNVPKSVGTFGHDDPGSWEFAMNPAGCDRLLEEDQIFSLNPKNFGGTLSWFASPRPDHEHTDGLVAADANWVLQRCAKEQRPFFLAVGFYRPHTPYVAPKPYFENYPLSQMPVVEGVEEDQRDIPPMGLASQKKEQNGMSRQLRQEAVQAYFASITFMDAQVGLILNQLDALGLRDNTIIVFTSDHGYHLGEHGLWQKQSLFEQSARVPFILAGPGIVASSEVTQPVGLIDLFPTLAQLCDVETPQNLQGQSLRPMLENPATDVGRGWAISQVVRSRRGQERVFGYSLRTSKYRFTLWGDGEDGIELYDHQIDPSELTNQSTNPNYATILAEHETTLRHAIEGTLPEDGMIPQVSQNPWAPNLTDP